MDLHHIAFQILILYHLQGQFWHCFSYTRIFQWFYHQLLLTPYIIIGFHIIYTNPIRCSNALFIKLVNTHNYSFYFSIPISLIKMIFKSSMLIVIKKSKYDIQIKKVNIILSLNKHLKVRIH